MRVILAILVAFPSFGIAAHEVEPLRSPRMNELRRQVEAGVPNAEEQFFATLVTPIVEVAENIPNRRLVTFVHRGDAETKRVTITGGRPVTDFEAPLERLPGTSIWFLTQLLPSDSRFAYFTNINPPAVSDLVEGLLSAPSPVRDPLNPNTVDGNSYVVLPDAIPFPFTPNSSAPKGTIRDERISSRTLSADINLRVYLPAEYEQQHGRLGLVVAFDTGFNDMDAVLDDLIATGKVPPMVLVGVVNRPGMRAKDLGYSEPFARFVVDELLPWARSRFRTSKDRNRTIIAGRSRGGGMAAFVALRHPRAFGKVLCISTAIENEPGGFPPTRFWLRGDDGFIVERYLEVPTLPLRFYITVGRFDTSLWTDRLVNNRRFRDMLRGKGYAVQYAESNGGHDELLFQRAYAEGLVALTDN